jgi:hypothetical protein
MYQSKRVQHIICQKTRFPNITTAWFAEYGISERLENQGGLEQLLVQFRQAVRLLGQDFDEPTGRLKMKKDIARRGKTGGPFKQLGLGDLLFLLLRFLSDFRVDHLLRDRIWHATHLSIADGPYYLLHNLQQAFLLE